MNKTIAATACALAFAYTAASGAEELTLSGLRDVQLVDSGSFVVSGLPPFAREETFEFLERPDGGMTLLSATTMTDGAMRVQARYDYDADWNAMQAVGQGIYEDEPVRVNLKAGPESVSIRVRGEQTSVDKTVPCPDGCFMDMAPSGSPMFVMTRRYDRARGGMQSFRWAGQDLRQAEIAETGVAQVVADTVKAVTQRRRVAQIEADRDRVFDVEARNVGVQIRANGTIEVEVKVGLRREATERHAHKVLIFDGRLRVGETDVDARVTVARVVFQFQHSIDVRAQSTDARSGADARVDPGT